MYRKSFIFICTLSILLCNYAQGMKRGRQELDITRGKRNKNYKTVVYQCTVSECKYWGRMDKMNEHEKRHLNPDKYPQCEACHFFAVSEAMLQIHYSKAHPDLTIYKDHIELATCTMCGISGTNLDRHIKTFHQPSFSKRLVLSKVKHNEAFPLNVG